MLLAVVTPTYNRAYTLTNLYESLKKQSSNNFKWYVVDDGSSDDTENKIKLFKSENIIDIEYIKKENGGKHTALNTAMHHVEEEVTIIVDSDDELLSNAIERIEQDYVEIKNDASICGLGYLKINKVTGSCVGKKYSKDCLVDTFINERINRNTYGDKCEVFKTAVLKEFPFPVFAGEKFLSENTVWCSISLKYKMKFYNVGIYMCEYLNDGLTSSVKKTLFKNPFGAVQCYLKTSVKEVCLKYRIKYTIAFATYAFAANIKVKDQFEMANSKFLYLLTFIPAYFIYLYKKRKFKDN